MNNISDVIPAGYDILNSRLEEVSVFKEDDKFFLNLRYRYKTKKGEVRDIIFPKVNLPFKSHILPQVHKSIDGPCGFDCPIHIEAESEPLLNMDENGYKIINKTIGKEMTLDEISKALSYNVIIKED